MSHQLRKEADTGNKDEKSQDTTDDLGCLHLQGCGMRIKKLLCVCIESERDLQNLESTCLIRCLQN